MIAFRPQLPRLLYALLLGIVGIGLLVVLTDFGTLSHDAVPLAVFVLLSFIVKRAGVWAGPDTIHSLVGIVDLAAVLLFGPIPGAYVPALSSLIYVVVGALSRERRGTLSLLESIIGNTGLKAIIGLVAGGVYLLLGGPVPPRDLTLGNAVPIAAAMATWFVMDNLGWAIWETLRIGRRKFNVLFRETLAYSILVELIPLPFALVIAVIYERFGRVAGPIFLLLAIALIEVAFVLQRYAEVQGSLERRTRELVALNEFGQAVARAGFDGDRVIELLMDYARRISHGDCFRLEVLNAEQDCVDLIVEERGGNAEWIRQEVARSPAVAYLVDNPASLLIRDRKKEKLPFPLDERVEGQPTRSAILLPLLAGEEVIGVFTVLGTMANQFYRHNVRNLSSMTTQAAIALKNSRLYQVERRRAGQLAIVSEVSRRVAQFLDLDELLQKVVEEIQTRFGYSFVHIFVTNENNELVFRASTHPDVETWRKEESIPAGKGIVGHVLESGEALLAPDVSKEPRYRPGPGEGVTGTRSELAVPLVVAQSVVGVLDVQSQEVGRFGEEDLFVLRTLAAQIAIAIEDARLYASQKEEAWYLNVLLQVSENLADTATLDEALETIVRITPILVGVARCAVFLYDPAAGVLHAAKEYGIKPEMRKPFEKLEFKIAPEAPGVFGELWSRRAPLVIENAREDLRVNREIVEAFDLESLVLTPLIYHGVMVGAMVVDQGPRPRRFTAHEIQIVMGISNQAAVAIENARLNEQAEIKKRFDYEIGLARRIQSSFLPPCCPDVPGYQLSAAWRAAREVSGDFYDFVPLENGQTGLSIADVSDKGMPAALFMVLTRTLLRAMAMGRRTPRETLERANDLIIADSRSDLFATAFYARLDPASGRLTYANAGHNPPLWYRRHEEDLVTLKGHGMALGVRPGVQFPEQSIDMAPGDILVFYTDGITEALNPAEEEFGTPRLADLVAANNHLSADELVDEILRAVYEFSEGSPQADDMTLVVLKRNGKDGA